MAFLVCYSKTVEDHAKDRAAYLRQGFYKTIFRTCRHEGSGFPILGRIANLRYKSPTLMVRHDDLPRLLDELIRLRDGSDGSRDLVAAVKEAVVRSCSLTISGDMYPELDGDSGGRHAERKTGQSWWRFW